MISGETPMISVSGLYYRQPGSFWKSFFQPKYILEDISFSLQEGESLAVIGEERSGKSELIAAIAGIINPSKGRIYLYDQDIATHQRFRSQNVRMVFQNPISGLNQRLRVYDILQIPLLITGGLSRQEREERIRDVLNLVDLTWDIGNMYPSSLSQGQLKRVAFARALILNPKIILANRAASAFDPNLRSRICNMLIRLHKERKICSIIATSDLDIARHICDKILVLNKGKVVEFGSMVKILSNPQSEITARLIANYNNEYRYDPDRNV